MKRKTRKRALLGASCLLIACFTTSALASTGFSQRDTLSDLVQQTSATGAIQNLGGRLLAGSRDVLLDLHGECRWLDNTNSARDYFVPTRTAVEWQAFIENAPSSIIRTTCCPEKTVSLSASDGQRFSTALPVGREGATNSNGTITVSHIFSLTRPLDGASWTEDASETYICVGGEWVGQGMNRVGAPPPVPCGTNPHGSSWFEIAGRGSRPATAAECPQGIGDRTLNWDIENEMTCVDGNPMPTGVSRNINEVWSGSCQAQNCAFTISQPWTQTSWSGNAVWRAADFTATSPTTIQIDAFNGACSPWPSYNHPFDVRIINRNTGQVVHAEYSPGKSNPSLSGRMNYDRTSRAPGYSAHGACWTRTDISGKRVDLPAGNYQMQFYNYASCHDWSRCVGGYTVQNVGLNVVGCGG